MFNLKLKISSDPKVPEEILVDGKPLGGVTSVSIRKDWSDGSPASAMIEVMVNAVEANAQGEIFAMDVISGRRFKVVEILP